MFTSPNAASIGPLLHFRRPWAGSPARRHFCQVLKAVRPPEGRAEPAVASVRSSLARCPAIPGTVNSIAESPKLREQLSRTGLPPNNASRSGPRRRNLNLARICLPGSCPQAPRASPSPLPVAMLSANQNTAIGPPFGSSVASGVCCRGKGA